MKRWIFGCLSRLVDHVPSLCPLSGNRASGESRFEGLERAAYHEETSRASDKMSHTIRKDTPFFFFLNAASLYRLRDMDGEGGGRGRDSRSSGSVGSSGCGKRGHIPG